MGGAAVEDQGEAAAGGESFGAEVEEEVGFDLVVGLWEGAVAAGEAVVFDAGWEDADFPRSRGRDVPAPDVPGVEEGAVFNQGEDVIFIVAGQEAARVMDGGQGEDGLIGEDEFALSGDGTG